MMSETHILRPTIGDEESSILVERSALRSLYTHLAHDTESLEECYYAYVVPIATPARSLDIDIFDLILAAIT